MLPLITSTLNYFPFIFIKLAVEAKFLAISTCARFSAVLILLHQQDAPPRHGTESQLFNIDGVTSPALVGDRKFNQIGGAKWCTNAVRPQPKGNGAVVMLP